MLICHIALCTHIPGGKRQRGLLPNHGPPLFYSHPLLINHLGKNITSLGYLQTRNPPLEFQQGHIRTRAGEINIFLSLSKQFFTGNRTRLLQMTSPNDTQGYAVLLLSLLRDSSILISVFVVVPSPPQPFDSLYMLKKNTPLTLSKYHGFSHSYSVPNNIQNNWRFRMQSQVIHHCE